MFIVPAHSTFPYKKKNTLTFGDVKKVSWSALTPVGHPISKANWFHPTVH